MTQPAEPIPDLDDGFDPAGCPQCDGVLKFPHDTESGDHWRCDHCRITWTPDGTGGQQT